MTHNNWQYLVLMRHGRTPANKAVVEETDSHFYSVSGSDETIKLDGTGELQTTWVGRLLAMLFPAPHRRIHRIHASGFRRVTQSAERVSAELGYTPVISTDRRLNKRSYGEFWNISYKGVEELYPGEHELFVALGQLLYRPPGGENYLDLFARTDDFHDSELIEPSGDNTLVLTHLVVVLALMRRLDGLTDEEVVRLYDEMAMPNGYVRIYRRRRNTRDPWRFCAHFVPAID
jgi:broad specificity phosphatase PhoE